MVKLDASEARYSAERAIAFGEARRFNACKPAPLGRGSHRAPHRRICPSRQQGIHADAFQLLHGISIQVMKGHDKTAGQARHSASCAGTGTFKDAQCSCKTHAKHKTCQIVTNQ